MLYSSDNRLYRESPAPPKSKSKAKAKGKGSAKKKKQQPQPPPPPPVRRGTRRGLRSAGNDTPPPEEEEAPAPPLTHEEEADEEWKPWKMVIKQQWYIQCHLVHADIHRLNLSFVFRLLIGKRSQLVLKIARTATNKRCTST